MDATLPVAHNTDDESTQPLEPTPPTAHVAKHATSVQLLHEGDTEPEDNAEFHDCIPVQPSAVSTAQPAQPAVEDNSVTVQFDNVSRALDKLREACSNTGFLFQVCILPSETCACLHIASPVTAW
jgi:hypothetical protein